VSEKNQAFEVLSGRQPLFDFGDGQAFTSRAALMQAEIAVGMNLPSCRKTPISCSPAKMIRRSAVFEFRKLTHKLLGHA